MSPRDSDGSFESEDAQRRLNFAAAALRRAASLQSQAVEVCLNCLRAVDLLLDAAARPDADDAASAISLQEDVGATTRAEIRAALDHLAGLPAYELAREPIQAAAHAARRALTLTSTDESTARTASRLHSECRDSTAL